VSEIMLAGSPSDREGERERVRRFLARRDEVSFRVLYSAHTPFLYALALRLCRGRRFDAEDIVQETWVRAVSRLAGFRWESALSTWLCGIAVRCFREQARKRREEPMPERDPPLASSESAEPDIDLERGVAGLAPGYREVLLLHDVHGYSHEEIGSLLGIDPGTSKSQLSRARGVLRERIGRGAAGREEEGRK
jgi:RNA polymerase sigma factor (sigma-70 family)